MAYTAEFRANVLTAIKVNGGNVQATAHQYGVPESTCYRWINENESKKTQLAIDAAEETKIVEKEFREDLATLRNKILIHAGQIHDNLSPKESIVSLGILIDKVQLLSGEATERREIVGKGESVDDAIQRLTRELESRPSRPAVSEVAQPEQGVSEK